MSAGTKTLLSRLRFSELKSKHNLIKQILCFYYALLKQTFNYLKKVKQNKLAQKKKHLEINKQQKKTFNVCKRNNATKQAVAEIDGTSKC